MRKLQNWNFFVDIDGTITDYLPGVLAPERLLAGNFLFPLIQQKIAVVKGIDLQEAETLILKECERNVFWCYGDFVRHFSLPEEEMFESFRRWHRESLSVYQDTVELLKVLSDAGAGIFIISNNPVDGCVLKLERAGFSRTFFKNIFGTDLVRGCKFSPDSWHRAIALSGVPVETIRVIGDDPHEDGSIPLSCGCRGSFILTRSAVETARQQGDVVQVNNAMEIARCLLQKDDIFIRSGVRMA